MTTWPLIGPRFPFLPIRVIVDGLTLDVEALIDTGFDGDVVLPRGAVPSRIPAVTRFNWRLADGSRIRSPLYSGSMELGPVRLRSVAIATLGTMPMIGRRLIQHFRVTLDHGERVIVEP